MANEIKYKITADNSQFKNAMRDAGSSVSSLGSQLTSLAAAFGVSFGVSKILEAGMAYEKAGIQLKTLTGSATEAKRIMEGLQSDALKSPFNLDAIVKVNNSLMSAGVSADRSREDVKNLSNAIAATGGGNDELMRMAVNLQQIKNVGKATAVDIKQFAYAGINVYSVLNDYADKHKIKIDKNNISYELLTDALKQAADKGGIYFGALDAYADSTTGKISNLEDQFFKTANTLFIKLQPEINSLITSLSSLLTWIGNNVELLKGIGKAVLILTGLWAAYNTSIAATTTAQAALNFVMSANPIGQVVIALGLLAGALEIVLGYYDQLKKSYEDTLKGSNKQGESKALRELKAETAEMMKQKGMKSELADQLSRNKLEKKYAEDYKLELREISKLENEIKDLPFFTSIDTKNELGAQLGKHKAQLSFISGARNALTGNLSGLDSGKKSPNASSTPSAPSKKEAVRENITIKIDSLVKHLELHALTLKEGTDDIKKIVGQALQEAVYGVKYAGR
jgi:hypothetical protein